MSAKPAATLQAPTPMFLIKLKIFKFFFFLNFHLRISKNLKFLGKFINLCKISLKIWKMIFFFKVGHFQFSVVKIESVHALIFFFRFQWSQLVQKIPQNIFIFEYIPTFIIEGRNLWLPDFSGIHFCSVCWHYSISSTDSELSWIIKSFPIRAEN